MRRRAAVLVDDDVRVLLRDEDVARAATGASARSGSPSSPSAGRSPPPGRAARRRAPGARSPRGPRASARRRRPPRRSRGACPSVGPGGGVGAQVDHTPARYRQRRGSRASRTHAGRARRARVPGSSGVGMDGAWSRVVRRHDDASEGAARGARRVGSVLDARGRHRTRVQGRHGERPSSAPRDGHPVEAVLMRYRDGAAFALPLVAVGLPAHVHVLRDRARCASVAI